MSTGLVALIIVGIWGAIVFLRLIVFPAKSKESRPGPHNNWRREKSGDGSSFYESGEGITGGGD